jgi:hypothetical protein
MLGDWSGVLASSSAATAQAGCPSASHITGTGATLFLDTTYPSCAICSGLGTAWVEAYKWYMLLLRPR